MKFSEQWLREWVKPALATQALADQLSLAGLEVDEISAVAGQFDGVVVAEIIAAEQHPDADKLQVCQVSDGQETFQVVCGAANARAGLKTAFARVGANLPGDFRIKRAKLRGVESMGMLCAEDELGISDDHGGIMELAADAPLGIDLRDYLNLNDSLIDVDLTPNRGDCLSIAGLAREVGVLNQVPVNPVTITTVAPTCADTFPVTLSAPQACPRYIGRVIRNINLDAQTPLWMQEKLRRSGIRSIDPVVDVTNYVLLELGQPMHAFDLNQLSQGIDVRLAQAGETLVLLDETEVTLNADTLLITDANGPLAMAGIMGGAASGVTAETRDIFLESAFFNPLSIVGRARNYGLHTDSSHRFERGVDWQLQRQAIERATALLLDIVGGEPGPVTEAVSAADLPETPVVRLRDARVNAMLAMEMPLETVEDILTRLGMQLSRREDQAWDVTVPSWRFDITLEVDLIEEIARVYGYDNLPVRTPIAQLPMPPIAEKEVSLSRVRRHLISRDYQEAVTYSFIEAGLSALFDPKTQPLALANPISAEMAVMRTSVWPGLIKAVQYNQNRQQLRIRLFETGQRFLPQAEGGLLQENVIAGVITGNRDAEGWVAGKDKVDFFDIKGDVESLLALGGSPAEFRFVASEHPALHPGQCARVERQGEVIGYVGALHPQLLKQLDLNGPVYLFELQQDAVTAGRLPRYAALSKFPEMRRDLSLLVDEQVSYDAIREVVTAAAGDALKKVTLFDLYQGQGIEAGRKSLALGLTWQHPSRTLTDEEINNSVSAVVVALTTHCGASLRE
ncbi:Phenylalanyl-tRNA synthetase beta chain [Nitrincola lacisaponensis]|uniref:Phenylalanine--tRNA ligase beta subunit n=1 Tax=Nitrincola lacisaponensis TaxID=267850 RepID=A0A063Y7K2_9GAMM|nr:phenylalanine--tRNA ligase subunit beta [Nitrincola lacisaponensis]KDE40736.1 Phenylalanyl-tRNA synthetase beta chain [Nitrincola lacisaponensis]